MAKKITAIHRYKPDIKREPTLQTPQLLENLAQRTGLSEGQVRHVVYELRDEILKAHRHGQAVKIDGLGIFSPSLRTAGDLDVLFRPEPELLRQLNDTTKFHAKIVNKPNMGKSSAELIAQWNREHPDDPVEE